MAGLMALAFQSPAFANTSAQTEQNPQSDADQRLTASTIALVKAGYKLEKAAEIVYGRTLSEDEMLRLQQTVQAQVQDVGGGAPAPGDVGGG